MSKNLHAEEKLEVYWQTITYISNLNRSSEIKAGLIISFYGLLLGVVFQVVVGTEQHFNLTVPLIISLVCFLFFVARSIYFSFKCFMPQIETKFDYNMFFFHDVVTRYGTIKEFSNKFMELLDNQNHLYAQLGEQIFVNSLIASKKFSDVNKSVKNLVYSFIPLTISAILIVIQTFFD
ncbi:Pycsar system effector family protein [Aegicerativicinus sediminis]